MMKQFTLAPRTQLDDRRHSAVTQGRWHRRVGRILLFGAAFGGGVEMVLNAVLGGTLPPVTLRSMLEAAGIARMPGPFGLLLDSPLWIVLLIAAAIPYAMAAHQFMKQKPHP